MKLYCAHAGSYDRAMPDSSALTNVLRHLVFGVLIAVMLVKPVLAFAGEIGELDDLVPNAALTFDAAHAGGLPDPDGCGDLQRHVSHCCAVQAALLPRIELGLLAPSPASPLPARATAFVAADPAQPLRPPIRA
ncbi:hypothetical protein SAMN05421681_101176 [Lysobacter enzymogenes]|nr:hypothetical protein SAMN05421681_101176 [Lysobacter enzymogenes]